jgi:hypothetical protein
LNNISNRPHLELFNIDGCLNNRDIEKEIFVEVLDVNRRSHVPILTTDFRHCGKSEGADSDRSVIIPATLVPGPGIMFPPSLDPCAPIRQTDSDAALARLSAVHKGYLQDKFISALVPRANALNPRPPLINIGTYVRSAAIDQLVLSWLALSPSSQIVSLGAGSDTRFWRIAVRLSSAYLIWT